MPWKQESDYLSPMFASVGWDLQGAARQQQVPDFGWPFHSQSARPHPRRVPHGALSHCCSWCGARTMWLLGLCKSLLVRAFAVTVGLVVFFCLSFLPHRAVMASIPPSFPLVSVCLIEWCNLFHASYWGHLIDVLSISVRPHCCQQLVVSSVTNTAVQKHLHSLHACIILLIVSVTADFNYWQSLAFT